MLGESSADKKYTMQELKELLKKKFGAADIENLKEKASDEEDFTHQSS